MMRLKKALMIVIVLLITVIAGQKFNIIKFNFVEVMGNLNSDEYASKYIYILDRENKDIEYKKNSTTKAYPASLTKIMTTIVAIEHIDNLSSVAPIDVETYMKMVESNASMAGFYGREAVTYRDLLYGTILSSGGEAANSLAINISGSVEEFVKLMNKKAMELGLKNTNFTNVEGLQDEKQYTTAEDMANLLNYCLEDGNFRAIFTKKTFKTTSTLDHPDGLNLTSTVLSKLDGVEQEGFEIIGGKSGTTEKAGECWITLGVKNGKEYIVVAMGAPLKDIHNPDMAQMYDSIKLYEEIK